jgi:3-isopropylmalate/(R)-2-methylmalate dehydratase large subunit
MMTGKLWFKVPHTIRIVVDGKMPDGVYAKDLILHIVGLLGADGANYASVEFLGPGITALGMEARFTISNMAVEMGAKFGVMEADQTMLSWLRERFEGPFKTYASDHNAPVLGEYRVDASLLMPQIARPHSPANVVPITDEIGTAIQQATIGTCTNGYLSDLREAASILRGHRIAPTVRLFVAAASRTTYRQALREGIIDTFLDAGGVVGLPGCSGCVGSAAFGIPADGVTMITTANRNFRGRTGNSNASIYLASPATVAASSIEGRIADPRTYIAGIIKQRKGDS